MGRDVVTGNPLANTLVNRHWRPLLGARVEKTHNNKRTPGSLSQSHRCRLSSGIESSKYILSIRGQRAERWERGAHTTHTRQAKSCSSPKRTKPKRPRPRIDGRHIKCLPLRYRTLARRAMRTLLCLEGAHKCVAPFSSAADHVRRTAVCNRRRRSWLQRVMYRVDNAGPPAPCVWQ